MIWSHRLFVLWMVATTLHLPVPICDGDDLKSGEPHAGSVSVSPSRDLDVILLGCDLPDDWDDGPVDDDPESGSGEPFASYIVSVDAKPAVTPINSSYLPVGKLLQHNVADAERLLDKPRTSTRLSRLTFTYGKTCQSGLAVLRC